MTTSPRALRLVVLSAGTAVPSSTRMLADRLAAATTEALADEAVAVETTVVEVRDLAHEVVDTTLTRFPGVELGAAQEALRAADGVVVVTPTYQQSYSGLFKSFIDVLDAGTLDGVPVLLGATGGTARHSLAIDYALRPLFAYLRADVVQTSVFAASEDFGSATTAADASSLGSRARRAGRELAGRMLGGRTTAASSTGPEEGEPGRSGREATAEFDDFVPMGDLLGR